MYQLMIIDDEPVVRAGIKYLIDWEDYDFEICSEGIDGRDGLRKILVYQPDLVLVDLKMPGLSGIELIREARKEGFEGKFIILTGYSDLDFAKSAVSLGVRAYLLKPIDEDELIDNIKEVQAELDAKKNLDDYFTISELKERQDVLRRILLPLQDKEAIRKEIKRYGMDFKYQSFCIAIIASKDGWGSLDEVEKATMMELLQKGLLHTDKILVEDELVLIIKGYHLHEIYYHLKQNYKDLKNQYGSSFTMAIGNNISNWEDLSYSYVCLKKLLDRSKQPSNNIIMSEDIKNL
ncbi:MAG TPA: response regulator [Clostridiales bacterium]|nr:response regulator [Clostridiales bacterium]